MLAADTVVALGAGCSRKPVDEARPNAFLRLLSGRRHRVITGGRGAGGRQTRAEAGRDRRAVQPPLRRGDLHVSSRPANGAARPAVMRSRARRRRSSRGSPDRIPTWSDCRSPRRLASSGHGSAAVKGGQILIEPRAVGGHAAALMVDGVLEDLLIDAPDADLVPRLEAIYRAVVGRPMKGIGGVMVDLGGGADRFSAHDAATAVRRTAAWFRSTAGPNRQGAAGHGPRYALKGRLAILTPGKPGFNISRSVSAIPTDGTRSIRSPGGPCRRRGADLGLILRSASETPPMMRSSRRSRNCGGIGMRSRAPISTPGTRFSPRPEPRKSHGATGSARTFR